MVPTLLHDHVRAHGVADLVFFSLEYPALRCDPASRVFADGLRFARIRFATRTLMFACLCITETRSYRAFSGVLLTESYRIPVEENTTASVRGARSPELVYYEL